MSEGDGMKEDAAHIDISQFILMASEQYGEGHDGLVILSFWGWIPVVREGDDSLKEFEEVPYFMYP
jgi:hypothetical protein